MARGRRGFDVEIENLRQTQRALAEADKEGARQLTKELKDAMQDISDAARSYARVETGKMRKAIRPYAKRGEAGVRVAVDNQGYPYAKGQEFDPRMGGSFLRRAVAENLDTADIIDEVGDAIERAWKKRGF